MTEIVQLTGAVYETLGAAARLVPENSLMSKIQYLNLETLDKYGNKYSPVMVEEFDCLTGPVISDLNAFDLDLQDLLRNEEFIKLLKKDMCLSMFDEVTYDALAGHIGLKMFESTGYASPYTFKRYGNTNFGAYYFTKKDPSVRGGERMFCLISKLNELRPDHFEAEEYLAEIADKIKNEL